MSGEARVDVAQAIVQLVFEKLEEVIVRVVEESMKMLEGERIARQVSSFYRGLVEGGVPEGLAERLTEKYLDKLLSIASPVAEILAAATGGRREGVRVVSLSGVREALEAVKEARREQGGAQ